MSFLSQFLFAPLTVNFSRSFILNVSNKLTGFSGCPVCCFMFFSQKNDRTVQDPRFFLFQWRQLLIGKVALLRPGERRRAGKVCFLTQSENYQSTTNIEATKQYLVYVSLNSYHYDPLIPTPSTIPLISWVRNAPRKWSSSLQIHITEPAKQQSVNYSLPHLRLISHYTSV